MLSTWNKFCFTGGLILTAVNLPGDHIVHGFWPAVWMMGNLGRAGYGASLEGNWPYSYDACDVGTVANQSVNGNPVAATINGDPFNNNAFSYLPGQKLSRCTCRGESHPGPVHDDGTYVGRSSPEIDIFEATVSNDIGQVSQSAQYAPFDAGYQWFNTSDFQVIPDPTITQHNTYEGGAYQMAVSGLSNTNQSCYERGGTGCFAVYGVEYQPGYDDAVSIVSEAWFVPTDKSDSTFLGLTTINWLGQSTLVPLVLIRLWRSQHVLSLRNPWFVVRSILFFPTDTTSSVVPHRKLGNVNFLWWSRPLTANFPRNNVDRLYPGVPTQGIEKPRL